MIVTKTCKPTFATDQDFRDFVTAYRAGFTDLGWVRTSDTGQIDPTAVLKPTVANTAAGYDIFRMGDTLQATAPFFVKLEYGNGAGTSQTSIWVTVGTGTNGAGTLTGNVSARQQIQTSSADSNLRTSSFAGGPNRIAVIIFYDAVSPTNNTRTFSIERSHADNGNDTAERVDFVGILSTSASFFQMIFTPGQGTPPVRTALTTIPCLATPGPTYPGTLGTVVGCFPIFANYDGPLRNPMMGMMFFTVNEIASLQDAPVIMYGVSRTYRTLPLSALYAYGGNVSPMVLVS